MTDPVPSGHLSLDKTWVSDGEVNDYRRRASTLAEVAAWDDTQVNLTGDGDPERVPAGNVTANLFSTLGVGPQYGRTFTAAEDVPNGPRLVVLSHGLWQRRYAADPSIIGRAIQINGNAYQVIGIMPRDFVLPKRWRAVTGADAMQSAAASGSAAIRRARG